jgi:AraC family transcriptional regulator of adaptative response/methylated-DNA-[protein]-cysteine methyltransferase
MMIMNTPHEQFNRIKNAIGFIHDHFKTQPTLAEVAAQVHLSPFHFQRLFTEWAGVSPKQFLQYMSLDYAKKLLAQQHSLLETAIETGLSGTSRLHDLFINIEGMTPGEYKNGGEKLTLHYSFAKSPFGHILIASTAKGICHMAFAEDETEALNALQQQFPKAAYQQQCDPHQQRALAIFSQDWSRLDEIKLHLKGSDFQLKVWETLLKIPTGQVTTYGAIAKQLQQPTAARAVGTAVGQNPIAFLIPCHRVIQANGQWGQYHWGSHRKIAMIGWEAAQAHKA